VRGPHVLITGATICIGLALARRYHARGARLTLVGRRDPAELDGRLFDHASYCRVDLAQPYAAPVVAEFLRRRGIGRLDVAVHCAGIGSYGPVAAQEPAEVDALLDTNLRAPIALTHSLLPLLEGGRLVFVGSVAAALPAPEYAVYGATKAALEGFARGLRAELRGRVCVQVIHPGATRTAMHARAGAPLERLGWSRFPPPERVARQVERAIDRGGEVVTLGIGNHLLRLAGRHLGEAVEWAAARRGG
jgi:short-subunit dehydrogenase